MTTLDIDFIRGYIKLLEDSEVPEIFSLWSAIAGVSCALGRKVWVDWGLFNIYPNFFIVLVAGSGQMKKSTAINNMEKIVRLSDLKLNIISQMLTPVGLIDAMRVKERIEGKVVVLDHSGCEGYVFADELNVFLNRKSFEAGLGTLLIPLYDCKERLEYRTKSRGVELVEEACLGILSGSTVAFIKLAIPEEAINTGLVSRILFVYVDDPSPPIHRPSVDKNLQLQLAERLKLINELSGEMEVSENLLLYHKVEYDKFYLTSPMLKDPSTQGYASRRFGHAMKIAMVLAVVERPKLLVETRHLKGALEIIAENEKLMGKVMELITTSESGLVLENIYERIAKNEKGISRTNLMRLISHKIDAKKLNEVLATLLGSGRVTSVLHGRTQWYKATKDKIGRMFL